MNDNLKMGDIVEIIGIFEKIEERIFIKHCKDGGVICVPSGEESDYKNDCSFKTAKWNKGYWRKKQDPKYIPFTYEDWKELIGKAIKRKNPDFWSIYLIFSVDEKGVSVDVAEYDFEELLNEWVFADTGKPVGKEALV